MSNSFVILPDVTCDLTREIRAEFDIEYIRGHWSSPDGQEHITCLEWEDMGITCEEYYASVKKNPNGFQNSPPNVEECYQAFEKFVKEGKGILAMSISTAISGTYSFMCKAREKILEKYPDAQIKVIDSQRFGPGFGLLAVTAAILRGEGKNLEETANYIEANKRRFHQMGWLDDLAFVAKKGRISHAKAFFGTLAGIRTLGEFDEHGLTTVIGKVKSEKQAYDVMLDYIEKTIENPSEQIIIIANTVRKKQALEYKALIEERFHPKKVYVCDVMVACGMNIGPGLVAAYYVGRETSPELSEEKAIAADLIANWKAK